MEPEEVKNETIYAPFCAIQNDWELLMNDKQCSIDSSSLQSQFWISLIKHEANDKNRSFIDCTVQIENIGKNTNIQTKVIKNTNDDNKQKEDTLNCDIKILPFNKRKKNEYYAQLSFPSFNLSNYHLIPSYHQISDKNSKSKTAINCIGLAKSSYFKRYHIAAGLKNGKINVLDIDTSHLKVQCTDHKGPVMCCKFFPYGDLILSGDTKGILHIYAIADSNGNTAATFKGHMGDITCIDFIGEGSKILSGATDSTVRLWNCSDQKQITQFGKLGMAQINQISVINDDKILLSSSSDGKFTFYDINSGKKIVDMTGCNGDSVESHCMLNENCVVLASDNGVCYVYDIRKLDVNNINCLAKIQRDERSIKGIIKCNKQNEIILYNPEGNIWRWKLDTNKNIDVNQVITTHEWTGNDNYGINDVVVLNKENNDKKLFVATKNCQIKEYLMLN